MKLRHAISLLALILLVQSVSASSRPRSAGVLLSPSGVELLYQHEIRDSAFFDVFAGADFDGIISGKTPVPGIRAGFTANFIFFSREYETGVLSLYAGPGIMTGMVRQGSENAGPMFGLCGKLEVEYRFKVPVILSFGINPVLGFHLDLNRVPSDLKLYKNGLLYSYYPKVGIKYSF